MPWADIHLRPTSERREQLRTLWLLDLARRRETDPTFHLSEKEYYLRMLEVGLLASSEDSAALLRLAEGVIQRLRHDKGP